MSLLFIDGFDHYAANDLSKKWDSVTTAYGTMAIVSGRRTGSNALSYQDNSAHGDTDNSIYKIIDNTDSTIIVGVAFYSNPYSNSVNPEISIYFYDDTSIQCYFVIKDNSGDGFYAKLYNSAGTELDSYSSSTLISHTWLYIEAKAVIEDSGGYELKINGETILTGSATDIKNTSNSYANKIRVRGGEPDYSPTDYEILKIDDLYILNGAGTSNNDFLGDCKIECIYPEGDYGTQEFTPSTGTEHFALVDETDPDDDSTYVYANLTDLKDRFTFGDDIESDGQIFGIQHNMLARKLTVGLALGLKALVNRGGTDYVLTQKFPESSYKFLTPIWEEDPYTTSQWLKANVNNIIAGFKMGTSS